MWALQRCQRSDEWHSSMEQLRLFFSRAVSVNWRWWLPHSLRNGMIARDWRFHSQSGARADTAPGAHSQDWPRHSQSWCMCRGGELWNKVVCQSFPRSTAPGRCGGASAAANPHRGSMGEAGREMVSSPAIVEQRGAASTTVRTCFPPMEHFYWWAYPTDCSWWATGSSHARVDCVIQRVWLQRSLEAKDLSSTASASRSLRRKSFTVFWQRSSTSLQYFNHRWLCVALFLTWTNAYGPN